ncbi:MAG TPA: patatin-like phospholipase family protein [Candidatus Elarobacter sp.]|nr:patatin-like phospholipase family protein [Candidatus Elarobacter sp.]
MIELSDTGYRRRLRAPGPKRLLALDGGGIRGLVAIEILARLEEQLRTALGRDESFALADYFDYVGGTSTGGILASGIAMGMHAAELREFYLAGTATMFKRAPFFRQFYYRNVAEELSAKLRDVFGSDTTFGDPRLRTLLMLVMRNVSTDSAWPLSNNPDAIYNAPDIDGCNLELPLWKLVRASAAAPIYFPPEDISVGKQRFLFVDGAITPYNNPAFLLFLMATLPQYKLGWEVGEDELLVVSVGTGSGSSANAKLTAKQMNLLFNVVAIPSALIGGALVQQDLLCRTVGRCRFGSEIDSEIGDLVDTGEGDAHGPFAPKKFTYVRYDPTITRAGLDELELPTVQPAHLAVLDSGAYVDELLAVGGAFGKRLDLAQLGPFRPAPHVAALAGRRADPDGAPGARFPLSSSAAVHGRLVDAFRAAEVSTLVCAAACGADLLALAAAKQLGIRRYVILPYAPDEFRRRSVVDRGEAWGDLFDRTIEEVAARGDLLVLELLPDDPRAFEWTNAAIIEEAETLAYETTRTAPLVYAVWDGPLGGRTDYTEDFVNAARRRGFALEKIPILS